MINGKFLAMVVFIYVVLAIMGSTFEGQLEAAGTWVGTGTGGMTDAPKSDLQNIANLSKGSQTLPFFGIVDLPVPAPSWLISIYRIVTLQFSFLMDGGYVMFYWVFLLPIAVAGIAGFVMLFLGMIRGNISWG